MCDYSSVEELEAILKREIRKVKRQKRKAHKLYKLQQQRNNLKLAREGKKKQRKRVTAQPVQAVALIREGYNPFTPRSNKGIDSTVINGFYWGQTKK